MKIIVYFFAISLYTLSVQCLLHDYQKAAIKVALNEIITRSPREHVVCEYTLHDKKEISEKDLQELIEKFFAKARKVLEAYDPFHYDGGGTDFHAYGIKFKGSLKDLSLSYMSKFSLDKLKVDDSDPTKISFNIGIGLEKFQAMGNYDINLDILTYLSLYGEGEFGLLLNGFNISLETNFYCCENNVLQLTGTKTEYKIESIQTDFKHLLFNDPLSDFINKIATDVAADFLMDFKPGVTTVLNMLLEDTLNPLMSKNNITLAFIIDYIEHFIQ